MNEKVVEEFGEGLTSLLNLEHAECGSLQHSSWELLLPYVLLSLRAREEPEGLKMMTLPISLDTLYRLSTASPLLDFLQEPFGQHPCLKKSGPGTVHLNLQALLKKVLTRKKWKNTQRPIRGSAPHAVQMVKLLFALYAHLQWPEGMDTPFLLCCVMIAHTLDIRYCEGDKSIRIRVVSRPTSCEEMGRTQIGHLLQHFPAGSTVWNRLHGILEGYQDPEAPIRLAFVAEAGTVAEQEQVLKPILPLLVCTTPEEAQIDLNCLNKGAMFLQGPNRRDWQLYEPDPAQMQEDAVWLLQCLRRNHALQGELSICSLMGTAYMLEDLDGEIERIRQGGGFAQLQQSASANVLHQAQGARFDCHVARGSVEEDQRDTSMQDPEGRAEAQEDLDVFPGQAQLEYLAAEEAKGKTLTKRQNKMLKNLTMERDVFQKRLSRDRAWRRAHPLPPAPTRPPAQAPIQPQSIVPSMYEALHGDGAQTQLATQMQFRNGNGPSEGHPPIIDLCSDSESDSNGQRAAVFPGRRALHEDHSMPDLVGNCYMDGKQPDWVSPDEPVGNQSPLISRKTEPSLRVKKKRKKKKSEKHAEKHAKSERQGQWGHDGFHSYHHSKVRRVHISPSKNGFLPHPESGPQAGEVEDVEMMSMLKIFPQELSKLVQAAALERPGRFLSRVLLDQGKAAVLRFTDGEEQTLNHVSNIPLTMQLLHDALHGGEAPEAIGDGDDFKESNCVGLPETLHKISALRNRTDRVVGLTCHIGRHQRGILDSISDLVPQLLDKLARKKVALLAVGDSDTGRTDFLRELAHQLADGKGLGSNVMIIDTRCGISGLADESYPLVKHARRIQVSDPENQHSQILDAACIHGCQVLIVEEICSLKDVRALRVAKQKGCAIMAGVSLHILEELCMQNPPVASLGTPQKTSDIGGRIVNASVISSIFDIMYRVHYKTVIMFEQLDKGLRTLLRESSFPGSSPESSSEEDAVMKVLEGINRGQPMPRQPQATSVGLSMPSGQSAFADRVLEGAVGEAGLSRQDPLAWNGVQGAGQSAAYPMPPQMPAWPGEWNPPPMWTLGMAPPWGFHPQPWGACPTADSLPMPQDFFGPPHSQAQPLGKPRPPPYEPPERPPPPQLPPNPITLQPPVQQAPNLQSGLTPTKIHGNTQRITNGPEDTERSEEEEDAFGGVRQRAVVGATSNPVPLAIKRTIAPSRAATPESSSAPIAEPQGNLTYLLPRIITGGKYH